jgi:septum site-determining protein MinD
LDEHKIGRTLNDYLWGQCRIGDTAYDTTALLSAHGDAHPQAGGALFLMPASIRAADIARITREGYDVGMLNDGYLDAIEQLKLDYLFVDTHPGINEETLLSIAVSDILVILLRPDQQDFQGTAVTVDVARRLDIPRLMLVVNKVLPEFDREEMREKVAATYDAPVVGVLPLTEDMVRLASGGIFSLQFPEHPWSREIRAVASAIEP